MRKRFLGIALSTSVSLVSMSARALQTMRRWGDRQFASHDHPGPSIGQALQRGDPHRSELTAKQRPGPPAKLLAVFVVDTNETKPTVPFGN
jgi:hypothetical protein